VRPKSRPWPPSRAPRRLFKGTSELVLKFFRPPQAYAIRLLLPLAMDAATVVLLPPVPVDAARASLHHPRPPQELPKPSLCLLCAPGCRSRGHRGRRSSAPPHPPSGATSSPTVAVNRLVGAPSAFPAPLPTLNRFHFAESSHPPPTMPPLPLWTTLRGVILCRGLNVKDRDLYVKKSICRSIYKLQGLVNCTKNHKNIAKMQTQFCCDPYD
jgi:hypothetical protein